MQMRQATQMARAHDMLITLTHKPNSKKKQAKARALMSSFRTVKAARLGETRRGLEMSLKSGRKEGEKK